MMETPVLNKKQQKKTLSTKKSKKQTIKNTLATPYTRYWPILAPEDLVLLHEALSSYLPKLKAPKVNIAWSELKNIPKDKRKEFREKHQPQVDNLDANAGKHIVFGVNEVTKLLETNTATFVLIASDVNPQLMVKHVVDMSVLQNVPLLVVPELRVVLKRCTGISSVATSIRNTAIQGTKLWLLAQKIKEIHLNYPVPKEHINYHRRRLKMEENVTKELTSETNDSTTMETTETVDINKTNDSETMDTTETVETNKSESKQTIYLYRVDRNKRVFVPPAASNDNRRLENKTEYLSLDQNTERSEIESGINYRSLMVKQVKGNKDRNKRKRDMMKKKNRKLKF